MDEPEFEERKQTEIADGLQCWTEGTEYGRAGKYISAVNGSRHSCTGPSN